METSEKNPIEMSLWINSAPHAWYVRYCEGRSRTGEELTLYKALDSRVDVSPIRSTARLLFKEKLVK